MTKYRIAFTTSIKMDTGLIEEHIEDVDYDMDVQVCQSPGDMIEVVKDADLVVSWGTAVPRQVIESMDKAQAIVRSGHGFDTIDDSAATERGIMVVNTAGFVTEEVADHSIMLLLACAKKLIVLDRQTRQGKWIGKSMMDLLPMPALYDQVLGVVGLGSIGRATAKRAHAFGLEVIGYDEYVQPWLAREVDVELVNSLEELASRADYVSAHTPLNDYTRGLFGKNFFKAMKPEAFFINTSRGGTTNEADLIDALQTGEIAGAGLDVFDQEPASSNNPLFSMENVIVTPHTAGLSSNSIPSGSRRLGEEISRILSGTLPMSLVNPEVLGKIPTRPPATNVKNTKAYGK